jgi:UDP-N-acetylmuramoylalanine--D-glutamate ligase
LALLADLPIAAFHLGGHREEDFQDAEVVVVNPAVRPDSPWLQFARQCRARLVTELELFMENCPARMIGVTGTNGKSTTAAMIASILNAAGQKYSPLPLGEGTDRQTFLGGNLGGSLLEQLPKIGHDDWVVLEISSFQLWHFTAAAKMPQVAVVTGCSPNHLDWHASYADYVAAKQRILTSQTPEDSAILNTFDAEVASWRRLVRGRLVPLPSPPAPLPRAEEGSREINDLPLLPVPGRHSQINAACAAAAAAAAGCEWEAIRRGLEQFRPLSQRLQWFAVVEGRRFYNDSAATTPESTIAALRSLEMPVWLLAGGKSKGTNFAPLAAEIAHHARGAALFGSAGGELCELIRREQRQFPCIAVETMEEAVAWCWPRSRPVEAILLSPACASTDQFRNFRQRGEHFVELVSRLANPRNR